MAITTSCPLPSNINPLSSNGFNFSIQKLPEVSFFCQEANLPSITLQEVTVATPLAYIQEPGEMVNYGQLNIQFLIDENMSNYKAVHNWLIGLGFPKDNQQYQDLLNADTSPIKSTEQKVFSDASLQILGSNLQPSQTVRFIDIFPTSLETLTFQSTATDVQYLVGSATFTCLRYEFD